MPLPLPDKAIQTALDQNEPLEGVSARARVWLTYQGLWRSERRRLDARIADLPEYSPLRGQLAQKVAIANGWITGTTGQLSQNVLKGVQAVTAIDAELDQPRSVVNNLYLQSAIELLDISIARRAVNGNSEVLNAFYRIFGERTDEAIDRFRAIVAGLRAIDKRTDGKRQGFIRDPKLPSEMAALASGHGTNATIAIRDGALNGSVTMMRLASQLAHEGSHALPKDIATIDIVYRSGTTHYALEPAFALWNASSFEQVVLDVLGEPTPNYDLVAARVQPAQRVRLAVASRVSRTWLRAWEFSNGEPLPDAIEKYLPDLPRDHPVLVKAYMTTLYQRAKEMMDYVRDLKPASLDPTAKVDLRSLIEGLAQEVVDASRPSVPHNKEHLKYLMLEIERFDRQPDVPLMTKFYASIQ